MNTEKVEQKQAILADFLQQLINEKDELKSSNNRIEGSLIVFYGSNPTDESEEKGVDSKPDSLMSSLWKTLETIRKENNVLKSHVSNIESSIG